MLPHGFLLVEGDFSFYPEHDLVFALDHHVLAKFEDQQTGFIDAVPLEFHELNLALHISLPLALHILRLTQQLLRRRHLVAVYRTSGPRLTLRVLLKGTQKLLEDWRSVA